MIRLGKYKTILYLALPAAITAAAETPERQIVTAPIVIEAGDALSIQAGSELLFAPFTGVTVKRGGRLYARGTKERPIIFTSVNDTGGMAAPFDWNGIKIDSGGTAALDYCLIANSTSGVTVADSGGLILTQCIFSTNGQWDLSVAGAIQIVPENMRPYDYPPQPPESAQPPPELVIPPIDATAAPTVPPQAKMSYRKQLFGWTMGGAAGAAAVAGVAFLVHAAEYKDNGGATEQSNNEFGIPPQPPQQQQYSDDWRKKRGNAQTLGAAFLGLAALNTVLLIILL